MLFQIDFYYLAFQVNVFLNEILFELAEQCCHWKCYLLETQPMPAQTYHVFT